MKKYAIIIGVFLLLFMVLNGMMIQAQEITYIPTSIPNEPGSQGDGVSRNLGGIFHGGIGVAGSQDESQLVLQEFSTQTNDPFVIQNTSGTSLFAVEPDGGIDTAAGIDTALYLLVGNPTPAVVTTPAAGDAVLKDDVEIQGDLDVAGTAELDGGLSVDDVFTVANSTGNIGTTGTLTVSPGASTLAATTITDTLAVSGMSTLTGGATGVLSTENIMFPTVASAEVVTDTSGAIFTITDGEIWFVHDVIVNVTEDFATGESDDATLIIGDGNDTDGFVTLADAELQAADTEATGFTAGWQGLVAATKGVYLDGSGGNQFFVYAPSGADETIDVAVGGTTPTTGQATVYIVYTRIQ